MIKFRPDHAPACAAILNVSGPSRTGVDARPLAYARRSWSDTLRQVVFPTRTVIFGPYGTDLCGFIAIVFSGSPGDRSLYLAAEALCAGIVKALLDQAKMALD